MTKLLDNRNIPCKYLNEWDEDVAGDGSMWEHFAECDNEESSFECPDPIPYCRGDCGCAGYRPMATEICLKHDEEYITMCGCFSCENEMYERMAESEKDIVNFRDWSAN